MPSRIAELPPTLSEARALLAQAGLPADDLGDEDSLRLFAVREGGRLVGMVGLQPLGGVALLRSLAVESPARGRGVGALLVATAEEQARRAGCAEVYLLTTGAAAYFAGRGYRAIGREEAPPALRATRQYAGLCPASAVVMRKSLA